MSATRVNGGSKEVEKRTHDAVKEDKGADRVLLQLVEAEAHSGKLEKTVRMALESERGRNHAQ